MAVGVAVGGAVGGQEQEAQAGHSSGGRPDEDARSSVVSWLASTRVEAGSGVVVMVCVESTARVDVTVVVEAVNSTEGLKTKEASDMVLTYAREGLKHEPKAGNSLLGLTMSQTTYT